MSLSFDLSRSPDLLHLKVGFPLFSSLLRCWRILGLTVTSSQDVSVATVPPFPDAVEALMILSGGRISLAIEACQLSPYKSRVWCTSYLYFPVSVLFCVP